MENEVGITVQLVKTEREAELCSGAIVVPGLVNNLKVIVPVLFFGFSTELETVFLN
jgi:hypothetical protein